MEDPVILQLEVLSSKRPGLARLLDFIEAVRSGILPDNELTRDLAGRFEKIILGTDPKIALELRPGRGTKFNPSKTRKHDQPIWKFIDEQINADPNQRGAQDRAMRAAAARFHNDERWIERVWARRPMAYMPAGREFVRRMKVIEKYITEQERERWSDRGFRALYRLANWRRRIRAN